MDRNTAQMLIMLAKDKIDTTTKAVSIAELLKLINNQVHDRYIMTFSRRQVKLKLKKLIDLGILGHGLKVGNENTYYITLIGIEKIKEVANDK